MSEHQGELSEHQGELSEHQGELSEHQGELSFASLLLWIDSTPVACCMLMYFIFNYNGRALTVDIDSLFKIISYALCRDNHDKSCCTDIK